MSSWAWASASSPAWPSTRNATATCARFPVGQLFGMNVSRVAVKQGAYLRSYIYTFIELLAPTLNRKMVESAMRGGENYEL